MLYFVKVIKKIRRCFLSEKVERAPFEEPKHKVADKEIATLVAYFNPLNLNGRRDAFHKFYESYYKAVSPPPLYVIEQGFAERPYDLERYEKIIHVGCRGGDLLWQKERLLNIGLNRLIEEGF